MKKLVVAVELRSHVIDRGRVERNKITTIVISTVVKFIPEEIFSGVFTLIHRVSSFCRVSEGRAWVLKGRRWRGRIDGLRRQVEVVTGVG